jgi:hypothetical protein
VREEIETYLATRLDPAQRALAVEALAELEEWQAWLDEDGEDMENHQDET